MRFEALLEKEFYERLDAVYAGLPDTLKEDFVTLMHDAITLDMAFKVFRRWKLDHKVD